MNMSWYFHVFVGETGAKPHRDALISDAVNYAFVGEPESIREMNTLVHLPDLFKLKKECRSEYCSLTWLISPMGPVVQWALLVISIGLRCG